MLEFSLVFKILAVAIVLGLASKIAEQFGKGELAHLATIIAILISLGLSIPIIIKAINEVSQLLNMF